MWILLRLISVRLRMLRHSARDFLEGSKLRVAVIVALVAVFWLLMFGMFLDAFGFLRSFRAIRETVVDYLFAFFFISLLVMMIISNAIIAYASLYRSEESDFFFSMPLPPQHTFVYRGSDSIVFSSWGMLTLVMPMIVAYGITFSVPLHFYPFAVGLGMLFMLLATELGALIALLVALVMPRRKKTVLIALALAVAVAGLLWFRPVWGRAGRGFGEAGIKLIMERIAFCQHWALPSHWVSYGMLSAARGEVATAAFQTLLLLSNVLFLGLLTHRLGFYAYARTWLTVQSVSTGRRLRRRSLVEPVLRVLLAFLPARLRLLVTKDLKAFLRDPSQWSQVLLFFGLLALYIVNLPRLGLESLQPYWHSLIANLNLAATCLTLATLTSRFVFPQLSLEGRRIWVTGLLPMNRSSIIWGKFFFTGAGTFLISGTLITLSDVLLGLPAWVLVVHLATVLGVCCGLNGMAVGLGALYPKLGTDNPSKIVSSFGGTLNLICSICFLALSLAPVVGPLHLGMLGVLEGGRFYAAMGVGLGIVLAASAVATLVPMLAGVRAFERMEF